MPEITDGELQAYLGELTEIAHRYGIGITGNAELFVLEEGDESRVFQIDDNSRLSFS